MPTGAPPRPFLSDLEDMVRDEITLWRAMKRQATLRRFLPGADSTLSPTPLEPPRSVQEALKLQAKLGVRMAGPGVRRVWGTAYAWEALVLLRRSLVEAASTSLLWFGAPLSQLIVLLGLLVASLALHARAQVYGAWRS